MKIIGIGHVARVGKDSAAEALVRDLGFVRRSLADPLKELALGSDPLVTASARTVNVNVGHGRLAWIVKGLGWEGAKDTYPEVRKFLQNLGVSARQNFGDEFWIDRLWAWAMKHDVERLVVPDVRFLNEAEAIQEAGGKVIRINRPGHHATGHISETELATWTGWDQEFDNNAEVADLQRAVTAWAKLTVLDVKSGK